MSPVPEEEPSRYQTGATQITKGYLAAFTNTRVVADDMFTLQRLVGFYEYARALKDWDLFLKRANADEIAAADEIIKLRPEFDIYTNLSRIIQPGPSTLAPKVDAEKNGFRRSGLAWMMAVAKVELQSMFAAFSNHRAPFELIPTTQFDRLAYSEVLQDGMRTHVWSFVGDKQFADEVNSEDFSSQTMAQLRRLVMLRSFISAVRKLDGATFSPEQLAELNSWDRNIDTMQQPLLKKVKLALARIGLKNKAQNELIRELSQCKGLCQTLGVRVGR